MNLKPLFRKVKSSESLSPKDWICINPRLVHVTTHTYNGEKFFQGDGVARFVKVNMFKVATINQIDLRVVGCDFTHCHFVIEQKPSQDLRKIIKILKGNTSRAVRRRYDWLNSFPRFWAKGFYVVYHNFKTKDNVFKYINSQPRELCKNNVPPL